ncbi:MAG TPA: GNVR domain-containing protein, partial [Hyphomicrobiales bacterium]|nr:GNVR domain-containing protein [Hyphomicrobiales bacterium]
MRPLVHSLDREYVLHGPPADQAQPENLVDAERLLRACRRQAVVVAAALVIAVIVGVAWLVAATPLYTADTFVLIDNRRVHAVEDSYDARYQASELAGSLIDSQVEVLKSENLARLVIKRLNLANDPNFDVQILSPGKFARFRERVLALFGGKTRAPLTPAESEEVRIRGVIDLLRSSLDVRRGGRTMILQISYISADPGLAAKMANAYAEAFLADQLDTKYEATKRASEWLEGRIEELKQKALQADLRIQKFKKDHDLVSSGGKRVSEQQLTEMNTQLVLAQSETAKAEARYARLDAIIKNHQTDAIVSEAIGSTTVGQLRTKYLELSKREADISATLGKDHLQAVNLRKDMAEYEHLMFEELGRLAESARSEVEIAQKRERSLRTSLEQLVILNATENTALVQLHEMEREAEAYQKLHQTYLQRYQEALQQQSFPIIEARVITAAATPQRPSHPKTMVTLLLFSFLGAALGGGLGFIREFRERGFRGEQEVKEELGLECLGILPLIKEEAQCGSATVTKEVSERATFEEPELKKRRWVRRSVPLFRYVLENPRSDFAETIQAAKLSADLALPDKPTKVIGVVSALPNEGKSVVSKNLASHMAALRFPTLLIDADLRGREITTNLLPEGAQGLVEILLQKRPLDEVLWWEKTSELAILGSTAKRKIS